jgi:enediyne biosynthesis protein E5
MRQCTDALLHAWSRDPRFYQIGVLASMLAYGLMVLDLEVKVVFALAIILTALATQYVGSALARLESFDPRSALISALSLCLLLRTDLLSLAAAAAGLAIASKFVIRWQGKHIFNPTNFALVVLLLSTDRVWVSPGQWGHAAFFAFLVACLGLLVVTRARRSDVTLAFLGFYCLLLFGRALWLADPLIIPWHQLQNGTLLIFAFFMISDPKTTPGARAGRILFAAQVALGAILVQFGLYRANGILYSLAACSLLVPLIDRLFKAPRYRWEAPAAGRADALKTAPEEPAVSIASATHKRRSNPATSRGTP